MYGYDDSAPYFGEPISYMTQPSFLGNIAGMTAGQPNRPSRWQQFAGGIKNARDQGYRGGLLSGLSGFEGSGGFLGGLGKAAHFLI